MIGKLAWQAQILDVIRYVLLLQHPSDLEEVTSRENANLSTIKTISIVPREISSLKPVLNWANVCSPNILRTLRRTMIYSHTSESRSKGLGFDSQQNRRENFLLFGQLLVLNLLSVSVPPPCYRSCT